MKIVFDRKDKPKGDLNISTDGSEKAFSSKQFVGVGVGKPILPTPPLPPPSQVQVSERVEPSKELLSSVDFFKVNYGGVFGLDVITASSFDVLRLNLLFGIYAELKRLNDKFEGE